MNWKFDYEIPLGSQGNMNPCYLFYLRTKECIQSETFQKISCWEKLADLNECKTKRRLKAFNSFYAIEYKKLKILSLPKYDDVTDSFVDGDRPDSADSFFNNEEKMRKFFDLNVEVKKEHSSH